MLLLVYNIRTVGNSLLFFFANFVSLSFFFRWIHPASGRVYSYSYKPPAREGLDDVTGEPLVQRDDDKPESVRTRLESYETVTQPLLDYYQKRGVLQSFTGTMSDVIYPQVKEFLLEKQQQDDDDDLME